MSTQTQAQFVRWVRAAHPAVYQAALSKVSRKSAMGGLGDDLMTDINFDVSAIQPNYNTRDLDAQVTSGGGNSWSDIIDSIAGAITQVAPAVVQTKSQWDTINLNATRARNGYPLVGSGALMGGASLGGNSMLLIGGLLLGGVLLLKGRSKSV